MKKLILMAIVLVTLATTVNAATWTCTASKYDNKVLLKIEVEDKLPSLNSTVSLRGQKIDAVAYMDGLDIRVGFGDPYHQIILAPDNYAGSYDFTGVAEGEKIKPSATYYCTEK